MKKDGVVFFTRPVRAEKVGGQFIEPHFILKGYTTLAFGHCHPKGDLQFSLQDSVSANKENRAIYKDGKSSSEYLKYSPSKEQRLRELRQGATIYRLDPSGRIFGQESAPY